MFDNFTAREHGRSKLVFIENQGIFSARPSPIYKDFTKRLLDTAFIVLSLPFLLPILLGVAFLVALDGKSPFYSQERLGRGGQVFRIWKFRSMVPNAERKLQELIASDPKLAREWQEHQKLKQDPRITKIGHLLRKTSIDELPQLLNVLKGEMSLVGPRPMMVDQRDMYPGKAYFAMRPGLTGLWQISDRNTSTFAARASFDTAYYQQMSLATDCRVLAATAGVVVRGTGC
jgi:lipopolysaccharide/colanic/teichoic acid biosynthesis glycosyltransferase